MKFNCIKRLWVLSVLFFSTTAFGQKAIIEETAIQTINRIFKAYMALPDANDIRENQEAMLNALHEIQKRQSAALEKKDLEILVRVWLDYNPPNFRTRKMVEPILLNNKVSSIEIINELLYYRQNWEAKNSSPGSDLERLREKISKN